MMKSRVAAAAVVLVAGSGVALPWAQTPAAPVYDVVSIKRNTQVMGPGYVSNRVTQRPDGGFLAESTPVTTLIVRAYPPAIPADLVGLPDWARQERYDITATSSRQNVTADERVAMLRAMLADRFKLVARFENRSRDVFELVMREPGKLGPGLQKIDADCIATRAAAQAARDAGAPPAVLPPPRTLPPLVPGGPPRLVASGPPPPCTLGMIGDQLEGQGAISDLLLMFRIASGREVVDKTGLSGFYQVSMRYDPLAARRPPDAVAPPDAAPTVFTAVQEQLGMRLVPAKIERETVVIDRLERPTEN